MALGWLWVALRGPYFCFLLSTFCSCQNVALGGLPPFLVQGSRFEVQRSTFSLRPEPPTQESRLPPACRKPDLYYEARRRLEWPKACPRESPMTARRLSHDSPVCLPGSDNRFGLCNWGPSDVSQKKTLYLLRIQRAAHPQSRLAHHVRINLRRRHIHVAQQVLHRANVRARLQQMGREGMAQHVRGHAFVEPDRFRCHPNRQLESGVQHVMAPLPARVRVATDLARREQPKPFPRHPRARILPLQRFRQPNSRQTLRPIFLV